MRIIVREKPSKLGLIFALGGSIIEPKEGKFEFSFVGQVLRGARENDMRVVLLWFGTWKSGAAHCTPSWVKQEPDRFPDRSAARGN